jgi:hypothetical protein
LDVALAHLYLFALEPSPARPGPSIASCGNQQLNAHNEKFFFNHIAAIDML